MRGPLVLVCLRSLAVVQERLEDVVISQQYASQCRTRIAYMLWYIHASEQGKTSRIQNFARECTRVVQNRLDSYEHQRFSALPAVYKANEKHTDDFCSSENYKRPGGMSSLR